MEESVYKRWLAKVQVTPTCWLWTASGNGAGHGKLRMADGTLPYAHRLSYEHFNGPIPEGLVVRHTCDEPRCVNPAHLAVGTHADNHTDMKDAMLRNDRRRYKLTADLVRKIREDPRQDTVIARELGVNKSTIGLARRRKTWAFVP